MVYCYKFPTLSLIIISFWGEWGTNCVAQTNRPSYCLSFPSTGITGIQLLN